jgi:hypothetical protein
MNNPDANQALGEIAPSLDSGRVPSAEIASSAEATETIRRLAEGQHGVVARRQLLEQGLSAELIKGRLTGGMLIPVHVGVFALGHLRIGREGRWMAAVLAAGPKALLSHSSAAELWSIGRSRGFPEVTRRSGGSKRAGLRLHQTRVLELIDVTAEAGIPVTSIERTLLDMAHRYAIVSWSERLSPPTGRVDFAGRGCGCYLTVRRSARAQVACGGLHRASALGPSTPSLQPRSTSWRYVEKQDFLSQPSTCWLKGISWTFSGRLSGWSSKRIRTPTTAILLPSSKIMNAP